MAQTIQSVTLQVDVADFVIYEGDVFDYAKFATSVAPLPAPVNRTFGAFIGLGDIVNINGKAMKGTVAFRTTRLPMSPAPAPGQAIADISRGTISEWIFEILQADGTPVGTFVALGLPNGPPPPGAPANSTGNLAIMGGTGAFLGATGYVGTARAPFTIPAPTATKRTSIVEDPSARRTNGGVNSGFYIQFFPFPQGIRPAILTAGDAPAVVHASDNSLVTTAKPARPGEVLTLYASGLGPAKTALNPGQPFPSNPLAVVNSPVEVLAGGAASEVLYAGGYPGTTGSYQVNFRLPSGVARGNVTLQLVTAFVPGDTVTIPVE